MQEDSMMASKQESERMLSRIPVTEIDENEDGVEEKMVGAFRKRSIFGYQL